MVHKIDILENCSYPSPLLLADPNLYNLYLEALLKQKGVHMNSSLLENKDVNQFMFKSREPQQQDFNYHQNNVSTYLYRFQTVNLICSKKNK